MKYKDSNGNWQTIKVKNYGIEQTPIGSMIYYPSQNIPAGYLVCDGSEKLIADYPLLFNAIGYIGGEDVAVGYFRLPDMRGAVPGGYNSTLSSGNPLYGQFGDQVGAPTHQLTVNEMPEHIHKLKGNTNVTFDDNTTYPYLLASAKRGYAGGSNVTFSEGYSINDTTTVGGGQAHSIVQPTKLYHWLIKAKNVVTLGGYTEDFEVRGNLTVNTINGQKTYLDVKSNTEIATNEYIDGKRVYEKIIKTTITIKSGETTKVAHGISDANRIWIDLSNSYFISPHNNSCYSLPVIYYSTTTVDGVQIYVDLTNINFISAGGWGESWEKVIRLKYTKN